MLVGGHGSQAYTYLLFEGSGLDITTIQPLLGGMVLPHLRITVLFYSTSNWLDRPNCLIVWNNYSLRRLEGLEHLLESIIAFLICLLY
jgi:hypothetical protein